MDLKPVYVNFVGFAFFIVFAYLIQITVISKADQSAKYPYSLKIHYSELHGVKIGSPVSIQGIDKGVVKNIKAVSIDDVSDRRYLNLNKHKAIEVDIRLSEPVTLWENYEISFTTKTLFAGRSIDIHPGFQKTNQSFFFTPTYQSGSFVPDYFPSATYYDDLMIGATGVFIENQEDVRNIVMNLKIITEKLNEGEGSLPKLLYSDETYANLKETIDDAAILGIEARRWMEASRFYEQKSQISTVLSYYLQGYYYRHNPNIIRREFYRAIGSSYKDKKPL